MTPIPISALADDNIETLFCLNGKKYGFPKLLLKALAIIESNLDPRAYRFEPAFFDAYCKDNPLWKDKDPKAVSASYGLCQIMYVVAWEMGFRLEPLDLYNPVYNIELCANILRTRLNKIMLDGSLSLGYRQDPIRCLYTMLAQYNGGRGGNPDANGVLRTYSYADKVWKQYCKLKLSESDCDDKS